jgi:arylsulfatase I/J
MKMTGMAEHLRAGGYATHQVGKWDAGMATFDHIPVGRGYDTSLGFFHHENDYWTEHVNGFVDMWDTDRPAFGQNGSAPPQNHTPKGTWREEDYEEFKFKNRVLSIISDHDTSNPVFVFYSLHVVHEPLEVPKSTYAEFSSITDDYIVNGSHHRALYHAMIKYADDAIGEIVALLKKRGMWEDTLVVFQTDNGGPSFSGSQHTANNYPLKGSKTTNWEGGIRGNAFVSGGFLQRKAPQRVGVRLEGYTHISDWYATFAALAGVDPTDHKAQAADLPPIDSINLWPYLSGEREESPRTEVWADVDTLIVGDWKIIGANERNATAGPGNTIVAACWMGPRYPNGTADPACYSSQDCRANGGCLYNIREDPGEHVDLASSYPIKLEQLKKRLTEMQPTLFDPNRTGGSQMLSQYYAQNVYGGYWGPFLSAEQAVVSTKSNDVALSMSIFLCAAFCLALRVGKESLPEWTFYMQRFAQHF